jgi:osmotically-inducible protein OsmY
MNRLLVLAILLGTAMLSGCTAIGVGAAVGSTAGVAAAKEGGLGASLEDARISATIHDLWLKYDTEMFVKLSLTVDQGRVLITGVVQKPEHRVDAVRLAWQALGVRQVINEIKVDKSEGIKGWARDSWITGRLRAAILFDKDIQGVNYSIDTVQSIVYLMGVAQNQEELNKVMSYARTVPYVKQVVSYVKLAGTPMNQIIPPTGQAQQPQTQYGQQPQTQYNAQNPPVMQGGMMSNNNPGPVASEPLFSRTAVPNAPPAGTQMMTPTGPTQATGRPAPIVDDGF